MCGNLCVGGGGPWETVPHEGEISNAGVCAGVILELSLKFTQHGVNPTKDHPRWVWAKASPVRALAKIAESESGGNRQSQAAVRLSDPSFARLGLFCCCC